MREVLDAGQVLMAVHAGKVGPAVDGNAENRQVHKQRFPALGFEFPVLVTDQAIIIGLGEQETGGAKAGQQEEQSRRPEKSPEPHHLFLGYFFLFNSLAFLMKPGTNQSTVMIKVITTRMRRIL